MEQKQGVNEQINRNDDMMWQIFTNTTTWNGRSLLQTKKLMESGGLRSGFIVPDRISELSTDRNET